MCGNWHGLADGQIRPQCIILMNVRRNIAKTLRIAGPVLSIDGYCASDPCLAATKNHHRKKRVGMLFSCLIKWGYIVWTGLGWTGLKPQSHPKKIKMLTHSRPKCWAVCFCQRPTDPLSLSADPNEMPHWHRVEFPFFLKWNRFFSVQYVN